MSDKVEVFYEATPNPQSMKFNITREICSENIFFDDPLKAQRSPLATKLFGFPWASAVFIGPTFVTVTKQDWVDWETLADPLSTLIQEHIESGEAILNQEVTIDKNSSDYNEDDPDVVKQIKTILNQEIRPAVAMDGGDIIFNRYEEDILYIHMQGACSGCPSSTITLKQGIEGRLKEVIPQLKEVIAL